MSIVAIGAEKNKTEIIGNPIEYIVKNVEFEPQQIHQADPCFYIRNKNCYSNTLENRSYLIIGNKRDNEIKGSAVFLHENAGDAHTGDYSYKFEYLNTFANDWLFSRCFNLEEDHSYEISFWYKTDSEGDFQLDLRLCTELDSLGEFIHWENDPAIAYTEIIDTVTIDSAGVYYFALQAMFWV